MNPLPRLVAWTKQVFSKATQWRFFGLPATRVDYLTKVGDGTGSSTVTAPLFWVCRTFPEAPPALWRQLENDQEEKVTRHALLRLLVRPNPFYTGQTLWMASVLDYQVDGNAYWFKVRNRMDEVIELWYTPSWLVEPIGNDTTFIQAYKYCPGGETLYIRPEDVVHFRFGADKDNPRQGLSPLKSVLREVWTDDEAAAFTASLLTNMGVPGVMVSPERGVTIKEEDAKEAKADLKSKFTGDNRGEPLVMTGATRIEQFGFSPEQLLLRDLRRVPEERVTAVMGIPAIVAGLGAGLDRSTFTNMGEAREAAYETGIIPMQRTLSEDVRFQLLPDFEPDPFEWRFGFDLSKVRVLQEDLYRQALRLAIGLREGAITVAEFRQPLGLDVTDTDKVYLRQSNQVERAQGTEAPAPAPANGNGNGNLDGASIARLVADELEGRELVRA